MATLQSTNVIGALCVNGVAVGGGKDYNYCCFTASTTFTPTSDLVSGDGYVSAHIVGGGGGGGGSYTVASGGRSPNGGTCGANIIRNGGDGAAGGFYATQSFIESTDGITVTIGASGSAGGAQDGILSQNGFCVVCYSESAVLPGNITPGGDGGNSVFNNVTAYGGCGGQACFTICKACGQGTTYCTCSIVGGYNQTVTNAGLYGGFRFNRYNRIGTWGCCAYGPPNSNCGVLFCSVAFDPLTGSEAENIPTAYDVLGYSGLGVEGVSSCKLCSAFANCTINSHCRGSAGANSCVNGHFNQNAGYGNGGVGGSAYASSNICCENGAEPTNFCVQTGSGANGSEGIVVIQWYE
jgi:hypothetical protein